MSLKILNIEPKDYSEKARVVLKTLGTLFEEEVRLDELPEKLSGIDVLITRLGFSLDGTILEKADQLKVIISGTTGLDHIDLDYCAKKNITVLSLQGETEFLNSISSTAEHTFGLILALIRKIPFAFDDVKSGGWRRDQFKGYQLQGKRLGIVGYGRLGRQVAKMAKAFQMEVGAFSEGKIDGEVQSFSTLDELLVWSDILTLHVPLNEQTRNMISKQELSKLSKGAYLINTSRGGLIDEEALLEVLTENQLAGAAVDVVVSEHKLLNGTSPMVEYAKTHDNLIITPHLGGATFDAMEQVELFMAEKLKKHLEGAVT